MKKQVVLTLSFFLMIFLTAGVTSAQETINHNKMDDGAKKSCCSSTDKKSGSLMEKSKSHDMKEIDLKTIDRNKNGKVYQCSMCPDQLSDESGECSKCGMNLNEVSIEDAQKHLEGKKSEMMNHGKMEGHMDHSKMMNHKMDSGKMEMKEENIVRQGEIDLTAIDKNKDGKVYQDQMCWNVISDTAGECPQCGMILKEVSFDKAKENLLKHDYKVK
jgi:uncharacterized protein with PIN domain